MNISKKQWILAGAFLGAVALALGVFWYSAEKVQAPAISEPEQATGTFVENATSTAPAAVSYVGPFPMNAVDKVVLGDFKGSYAGNATLIAQANADIAKLTALIGTGKYDDYDLYDGIANDYMYLGKGTIAYDYYNRSIQIHPNKGLAYANLAHLMSQLGAYHTAADAYAKAVAVEPGMLEYHLERIMYLTQQFPKDTALITAALTDASKQFGDNASILSIEAQWLTSQGRYADAITAWQTAKKLSPGKDTTAIDTEIARLQAKQ